jgi:hypothetical protein
MLQMMGQSMGVMIDRTPKCHYEGIKYSWAKHHFRQILLEEKEVRKRFLQKLDSVKKQREEYINCSQKN